MRATARDLRDALFGLVATAAALLIAAAVLDGLAFASWWTAVLVALVMAVGDALSRPPLRALAGRAGPFAALLLGGLAQLLLVELALLVAPGVTTGGAGTTVATLLLVGLVLTAVRWLLGVNDSSYLVADLVRRRPPSGDRIPGTGVVIVQWDGVSFPVLRFGLASGALPTLARWLRSGSHEAVKWWARVPSTTPVSQAGLLHGRNDEIPAFRWYEKESGRLLVANRPADAAVIEARISDGRGLLAGGGVSVSNIFSGDAPTTQMVMSRTGKHNGAAYVRFFARPFVFVRALVRTLGEMAKELYQGRRQRLRGVEPRIRRRGSYVALRGLTNAMLRDLNVGLVAEHMMAGAPVIFVDFVDYDEIAHHAGVVRPESLAALAGLDGVLDLLEKVAAAAPRDYRFVVLSDHGQSQGSTFRQLTGRGLEDAVREHSGLSAVVADTTDAETGRPAAAMVGSPQTASYSGRPELVVVGSGNLGLVWFPRLPGRVPLEELTERFPKLIPGLLSESGVGFLVADSARGPVAIGSAGTHVLADDTVEGSDPLAPFGPHARFDLLRVGTMGNAPDLYVHSTLDPHTFEVHAFEELVGCHGGLGGWQNEAMLVHPADWPLDGPPLYGADAVHRRLVGWLERLGQRAGGML
ncbi:alkaline phosphatase family protein [Actinoplanes sp. TBRC 11911]|uniref:alkaline phosphatase family protein n=1 Tax=Actinoplanes sp. TBRC 11911 TaxID=2729386 RepID=UPI001B7D5622|nr:alkaline phosphatase family protein [Actinoplanes sp. TBRC 11911]